MASWYYKPVGVLATWFESTVLQLDPERRTTPAVEDRCEISSQEAV